MVVQGACNVCQVSATTKCSACFTVFYCSPEHQRNDWKQHKKQCQRPYYLEENAELGRFMVAGRDLQPGEIILREKAAVHGPNQENSPPLCIVCYARLTPPTGFTPCPKCSVPMCSEECSKAPSHQAECEVLRRCPSAFYSKYDRGRILKPKDKAGKTPNLTNANWQIIMPLRVLLLKKQASERVDSTVVRLLELYQLHSTDADFRSLVQQICGIFDTNCFDLMTGDGSVDLSGVFPTAAMMMHSCVKNSRLTMSADFVMTLYAREAIPKGTPISHSYARLFLPTTLRRLMLFTGKHFSCECKRCSDATEMGSFASALLCDKCCGPVVPEEPLDLKADWSCYNCGESVIPGPQAALQERQLKVELDSINKQNLGSFEAFLARNTSVLHPRHAFIVQAKQVIFTLLGQGRISVDIAKRRLQLARDVLEAIEALETGMSARKGIAYHDVASALIYLNRDDPSSAHLNEADALLTKALDILALEPPRTVYGTLFLAAQVEKEKVTALLNREKAMS